MNNILFGGTYPDKTSFVHYETLACGSGGGPSGKGADAIQIHMTNTLNTPVEAVERDFPVRIVRYALRDKASNDTPGIHPGGRGVCREYQFLQTTEVTIISERRAKQPYGLNGAPAGQLGRNWIKRNNNPPQLLGGKATLLLEANDCLIIETPCGGAYQPPE